MIEGRKFDVMIFNGIKMIFLEVGKIIFKDFMVFFFMVLFVFIDIFGFIELKKGFFLYKFYM